MEKALLVISFGTSFPETREKNITSIENDLKAAFPDRAFYSAFTSGMIRRKIEKRDGEKILSPEEAFEQMLADGVRDVLVQPTHLLTGDEYDKVVAALDAVSERFEKTAVGRPLIATEEDAKVFMERLAALYPDLKDTEMAVFMGHGSEKLDIQAYDWVNDAFHAAGHDNMIVGTVEFTPGIEPCLSRIRERKPERVYLAPMLVVAGDHANNDMAGDEPDSWKNQIAALGCEVTCILKGLGEYPNIRELYLEHAKEA